MAEMCAMCGRKIHLLKTRVKDGFICGGCLDRLSPNLYAQKDELTGPELEEITRKKEAIADARKYTPVPVPVSVPFNVPKGPSSDDKFGEIEKWKELLDKGIITEEEFQRKKKEILDL